MGATRPLNILVIEDDLSVTPLLERVLSEQGYVVTAVSHLREAVSVPRGGFALIVTSARAPYLSGEDLMQQIHDRWPGVPVLHLDDLSRSLPRGLLVDLHSPMKPFSIESLLLAVRYLTETDSGRPGLTG